MFLLSLVILFILTAEQYFSARRILFTKDPAFSLEAEGEIILDGSDTLPLDSAGVGDLSLLGNMILRTFHLWVTLFPCLLWLSVFGASFSDQNKKKLYTCLQWTIAFGVWYLSMKWGQDYYNDVCLRYIVNDGYVSYGRWILACILFTLCATQWKQEGITDFKEKIKRGWKGLVTPGMPLKKGRLSSAALWLLEEKPFPRVTGVLFSVWSLYGLFHYPGIMMGDTWFYYASYHGLSNNYSNSVVLLSPDQMITNHHSVVYTYFMNVLGDISEKLTGTVNLGFYICVVMIAALFAACAGYGFSFLKRAGVSLRLRCVLLMITCLYLPYAQYSVTLMKDTGYAAFFLVYMTCLMEFYRKEEWLYKKKNVLLMLTAILGMLLFRKNGFFVLVISVTALFFLYKTRKTRVRVILMLAFVLICQIGYKEAVLPALSISDSSPREMLSVPFQQTARYLRDYPQEVTVKEKEAIEAVLDYENLGELYSPNISDPVKDTFHKDATEEDLKNYFQVWWEMLWKHPMCYIQAYWENYNNYFIPASRVETYTQKEVIIYSRLLQSKGCNITIVKNPVLMALYHVDAVAAGILVSTPYLSLIFSVAAFTWLTLGMAIHSLFRRKWRRLIVVLPCVAALGINCLGPVDGVYMRYTYPCIMPIWMMLMIFITEKRREIVPDEEQRYE